MAQIEDEHFAVYAALRSLYRGPLWMERLERLFWLEIWRTPVIESVEDHQIEQRFFGSIQATIVRDFPDTPLLNLVLGAGMPGTIRHGHLEEALDWIESLGVRCRIPIAANLPESAAAEEMLERRGYELTGAMAKFARPATAEGLPEAPGIEVVEIDEYTEGFGDFFGNAFELPLTAEGFFGCLPEREYWRCYVAIGPDERAIGGAAMMLHHNEYAQLGFAAVAAEDRGQGAHLALLRRRILDVSKTSCPDLFADTDEPLDQEDGPSPGARNLIRAGFRQVGTRNVWQPPRATGEI